MKGLKVVLVLDFLFSSMFAYSQASVFSDNCSSTRNWMAVSGNWKSVNGRLAQTDAMATIAMATAKAPQSGTMLYEFDVEYIGGGEDDYAGFGFHIGVSNPSRQRSWGNGRSMLAWVTFDPDVYGWPGAFIHVYQSHGPIKMGLYPTGNIIEDGDSFPVNEEYLKYEYLAYNVPVKLALDFNTGKGRFYDPFAPDRYYFPFDLGASIASGDYFTFRTNSVSLSIDNVKISKLD
jgi:hypothetical protein